MADILGSLQQGLQDFGRFSGRLSDTLADVERRNLAFTDPAAYAAMQNRQAELDFRRKDRALQMEQMRRQQEMMQQRQQALGSISPQIAQRFGIPEESISALGIEGVRALGDLVSPDSGATGALAERVMAENPGMSFTDALGQVQTGFRRGVMMSGGQATPIAGFGGSLGTIAGQQERGRTLGGLQARQELEPQVVEEVERAKMVGAGAIPEREKLEQQNVERQKVASRALVQSADTAQNINSIIDKSLDDASVFTTGLLGSVGSLVPGTPQYDLAQNLKTIEADASFDTLQQMRNASKTGGALGAVSERELGLLGAARAALIQSQSPDQFKENLTRYKEVRNNALRNSAEAYKLDFGEFPEGFKIEDFEKSAPVKKVIKFDELM